MLHAVMPRPLRKSFKKLVKLNFVDQANAANHYTTSYSGIVVCSVVCKK